MLLLLLLLLMLMLLLLLFLPQKQARHRTERCVGAVDRPAAPARDK